jgi:hypothetical protein
VWGFGCASCHTRVISTRVISTRLLFVATALAAAGCRSPSEPAATGQLAVFDQVVREFGTRYPTFAIKGIDWAALSAGYRARLTATSTDRELFTELSSLLGELRDVHVRLITPLGTYQYLPWRDRPPNVNDALVQSRYVSSPRRTASGRMLWGRIGETGYVRVSSLSGSGWATEIDQVLDSLGASRSLVMDLRGNPGGDESLALTMAGRFVTSARVYARIRVRNGPGYADLAPPVDKILSPRGTAYAGAVAVLTSRGIFSSAESFVLMMRQAPNVIVVGDTTGGGSANPLEVRLTNGWTVWVSRWVEYEPSGQTFEGRGIIPDVPVWLSSTDRDAILETALVRLM